MKRINRGRLLLAEPFMGDPNFKRAVILLCEHNDQGSFGFIINRFTNIRLKELVEDFPEFNAPVLIGGPVQPNTLQFLHKEADIENSVEVAKGVYWGGSFESLKEHIRLNKINATDVLFVAGYCGWTEGQLEEEMKTQSWIVSDSKPEYVFTEAFEDLWCDILRTMGPKYKLISSFPIDPSLN
ncbi:YqgE/AlgH family protein [soil metagenome]